MRRALSLSAAAFVMLMSAQASAAFHEMKVVEVFAGSAAAPNASYVQLQMYSAGQNFVGTHTIKVYNAAGVETNSVTLADVANGADQANILIGTASVAAAFGVAPDFTLPANLPQAGGAVCFDAIDCFSWGTFAGAAADTSVNAFAALDANKAARRIIAGGASPTLLEAADDSNSNATDFAAVDPAPKNNGGVSSDGGTNPPADAGVDSSTPPPAKDSGIGTQPSPNNPTVPPDSGTTAPGAGSGGDDSGCSFAPQRSEGWSAVLGLFAAASMFAMSRRRRNKR